METELAVLAALGLWTLFLTIVQGTRNVIVLGLSAAAGNQHDIQDWHGWHDRLNRAIRNQVENMVVTIPVLVSVILAQKTSDLTHTLSVILIVSRVLHSLIFIAGIPYLRTAMWFVGVGALVAIIALLF